MTPWEFRMNLKNHVEKFCLAEESLESMNISLTSARNSWVNNSKNWLWYEARLLYTMDRFLDLPLPPVLTLAWNWFLIEIVFCLHSPFAMGVSGLVPGIGSVSVIVSTPSFLCIRLVLLSDAFCFRIDKDPLSITILWLTFPPKNEVELPNDSASICNSNDARIVQRISILFLFESRYVVKLELKQMWEFCVTSFRGQSKRKAQ